MVTGRCPLYFTLMLSDSMYKQLMSCRMTWIVEKKRSWAEWLALRTLLVGPIPTHLAVIMDGNRRYARQKHQDTLTGHTQGFHKLAEMLGWCRDLGINQITAYAFSIENFKRSKQEVCI